MLNFRGEQSQKQQQTKIAERLQEFKNTEKIQDSYKQEKAQYIANLQEIAQKIENPQISQKERLENLEAQNRILKKIQEVNVGLTSFLGRQREFAKQLETDKQVQKNVATILRAKPANVKVAEQEVAQTAQNLLKSEAAKVVSDTASVNQIEKIQKETQKIQTLRDVTQKEKNVFQYTQPTILQKQPPAAQNVNQKKDNNITVVTKQKTSFEDILERYFANQNQQIPNNTVLLTGEKTKSETAENANVLNDSENPQKTESSESTGVSTSMSADNKAPSDTFSNVPPAPPSEFSNAPPAPPLEPGEFSDAPPAPSFSDAPPAPSFSDAPTPPLIDIPLPKPVKLVFTKKPKKTEKIEEDTKHENDDTETVADISSIKSTTEVETEPETNEADVEKPKEEKEEEAKIEPPTKKTATMKKPESQKIEIPESVAEVPKPEPPIIKALPEKRTTLPFEDTFQAGIKKAQDLKTKLSATLTTEVENARITMPSLDVKLEALTQEFKKIQEEERTWHTLFRAWQAAERINAASFQILITSASTTITMTGSTPPMGVLTSTTTTDVTSSTTSAASPSGSSPVMVSGTTSASSPSGSSPVMVSGTTSASSPSGSSPVMVSGTTSANSPSGSSPVMVSGTTSASSPSGSSPVMISGITSASSPSGSSPVMVSGTTSASSPSGSSPVMVSGITSASSPSGSSPVMVSGTTSANSPSGSSPVMVSGTTSASSPSGSSPVMVSGTTSASSPSDSSPVMVSGTSSTTSTTNPSGTTSSTSNSSSSGVMTGGTLTPTDAVWISLVSEAKKILQSIASFLGRSTDSFPPLPPVEFIDMSTSKPPPEDPLRSSDLILNVYQIILIENITRNYLPIVQLLSEQIEACHIFEEIASFLNNVDTSNLIPDCSTQEIYRENLIKRDELRSFISNALIIQEKYVEQAQKIATRFMSLIQNELLRNISMTIDAIADVKKFMENPSSALAPQCSNVRDSWKLIQQFWESWFDNVLRILGYITRLEETFHFRVPTGFNSVFRAINQWNPADELLNDPCVDAEKWVSDLNIFQYILNQESQKITSNSNNNRLKFDVKFTQRQVEAIKKLQTDAKALLEEQKRICGLTTLNDQEKNRCKGAILKLERVMKDSTNLLFSIPDVVVKRAVEEGVLVTTADSELEHTKKLASDQQSQALLDAAEAQKLADENKKEQDLINLRKDEEKKLAEYVAKVEDDRLKAIGIAQNAKFEAEKKAEEEKTAALLKAEEDKKLKAKRKEDDKKIAAILASAQIAEEKNLENTRNYQCKIPSDISNQLALFNSYNQLEFCKEMGSKIPGDAGKKFSEACRVINDRRVRVCDDVIEKFRKEGEEKYPDNPADADKFFSMAKLYGSECATELMNDKSIKALPEAKRQEKFQECQKRTNFKRCDIPTRVTYKPMKAFSNYVASILQIWSDSSKLCPSTGTNISNKKTACENIRKCDFIPQLRDQVLEAAGEIDSQFREELETKLPAESNKNCLEMCQIWKNSKWNAQTDCPLIFKGHAQIIESCKQNCLNEFDALCLKGKDVFNFNCYVDANNEKVTEECEELQKNCSSLHQCIESFEEIKKNNNKGGITVGKVNLENQKGLLKFLAGAQKNAQSK